VNCQGYLMAVFDVIMKSGMWVKIFRRNVASPFSGKSDGTYSRPDAPATY